ncbi:MAG: hypothetical protein PHR25_02980 [Clostridia bacterium]|nr:hypothetical protein [Clostridia bacterium]MDD4375724.1 hypothetical protein [Clostridia bacterium]
MIAGKLYSIAAIILGLISVGSSMIFFVSFPAAVLAITYGIFAVRRYYTKSGTTAIILGIVGTIITIVVFINLVSSLNIDNLLAGNWNIETGEYITFTDRGTYVWNEKKEDQDNYSSGQYKFSSGLYKNKKEHVLRTYNKI